jgi:transcription initiation factor IIE alpha subunit
MWKYYAEYWHNMDKHKENYWYYYFLWTGTHEAKIMRKHFTTEQLLYFQIETSQEMFLCFNTCNIWYKHMDEIIV